VPFNSSLLPPLTSFWSRHLATPVSKLQHDLLDIIDTRLADDLVTSSCSIADKARLISCRVKRAGAWLTVFPATSSLFLSDSHYALAYRLRLGLPPQDDLPLTCKCGTLLAPDPNHFLSCKLFRRTIVTTRHDLLVRTLATFIRAAGGAVYVEPKFFGSLRPDAHVYFAVESCTYDCSVTHPASPHLSLQGSKTPLAVAKLRETAKHRKYDAQAAKERIKFYPFVMETFGGVGKEAVAFIKKISNLHYEHSPVPVHRNALSSFIFRSLSIILQRGNALVQLMAAQYAREWAGGQCGY